MDRRILGLFVLVFPVLAHAQEVVDASLVWRSSEVGDGVVLGDVRHLVPSTAGVVATSGFLGIDAVLIDHEGTKSEALDIEGESPGHVDRPAALDVSRDGSAIAIVAGMGGHGTCRTPIDPPFDRVVAFDPLPRPPGMPQRYAVRLVEGAVITHTGVQPSTDPNDILIRLVRHELDGRQPMVLLEQLESPNASFVGGVSWVWDATDDGWIHVSDRYYEGTIAVISVGGSDGRVRVVSSKGLGAGQDEVGRLAWWEVDSTSGDVLGQRSLALPGGRWSLTTARWFESRIYVAGNDLSMDGAPEVLCFETE